MSAEDDDLPVLTQVLRTGNGEPPAADDAGAERRPVSGSSIHLRFDDVDHPDDTPGWPRALVIGNDPDVNEDAAASEPHATVADPRRIDLLHHDVFLRTAPTDAQSVERFDEPPLVERLAVDGDATIGRDVPLVFRDRTAIAAREAEATFALRIRDSVLQELSARIDTELDARIAQTLHAGLETALAHLQTSLRVELAEALRDVVGHAVDDAVARVRDAPRSDGRG